MPSEANPERRPIMTSEDQVAYLRDAKNVTFLLMGERQAVVFLEERNFFFKLKAFAKDFEKYVDKPGDKGRYVNLDFGHLVELSKLDNALRSLVLELALDVEHYLKVRINAAAMRAGADPYAVTESFFARSSESVVAEQLRSLDLAASSGAVESARKALSGIGKESAPEELVAAANDATALLTAITGGRDPNHVLAGVKGMEGSPYSGSLAAKYADGPIPLWVLLELVSFGPLTKLYRHCFGKDGVIDDPEEHDMFNSNKALLHCTQQLRNAAAHNDCLLNGLAHYEKRKGSHGAVRRSLVGVYDMDPGLVAPVASVRVAMDLAALLMCYEAYVPAGGSRRRTKQTLAKTAERFARNAGWFDKTYAVSSFMAYVVSLMETFSKRLA